MKLFDADELLPALSVTVALTESNPSSSPDTSASQTFPDTWVAVIPARSCPSNSSSVSEAVSSSACLAAISLCLLMTAPLAMSTTPWYASRSPVNSLTCCWAAPSCAIASSSALSSWSTVCPCASGQVKPPMKLPMSADSKSICAWVQAAPSSTASPVIVRDGEAIGAVTGSPSDSVSGSAVPPTKAARASP